MTPPLLCVCGCGVPAVHRHHVVYRQEIQREGGDVRDPRVLVPVAERCHARHHSQMRPLQLARLPDRVFDFARELLGAGRAYEYLRRRYAGEDPRLDALLIDEED